MMQQQLQQEQRREIAKRSLVDACAEPFAVALALRSAVARPGTGADGESGPLDGASLRASVHAAFDRMGQQARAAGIDSQYVDAARYALSALIDEIALGGRDDTLRTEWVSRPLQMELFGSFNAGEEFFTRLEGLRRAVSGASQPVDVDLLEVYGQALGLGFRGKYADYAGMQKVAELLDQICAEVLRARGHQGAALSDRFVRHDSLPDRVRQIPVWVAPAVAVAAMIFLLWVLDAFLDGQASAALSRDGVGGGQ